MKVVFLTFFKTKDYNLIRQILRGGFSKRFKTVVFSKYIATYVLKNDR